MAVIVFDGQWRVQCKRKKKIDSDVFEWQSAALHARSEAEVTAQELRRMGYVDVKVFFHTSPALLPP